jgi:hypothetical protein
VFNGSPYPIYTYTTGKAPLKKKSLPVSSSLPVCPHGTTWLPLAGFELNLTFDTLIKICCENSNVVKLAQKSRALNVKAQGLLYLYNNQHSALIQWFILRFCLTCFGLTYSQSSRSYVYNVADGDCLLKCRLSMAHRPATFKETITICHIVHVASGGWAVCEPETCKAKTQNKSLN